ncbi:hypothetical protein Psta_2433 [Pirellula staleyi DSM 6068]|uniref:Uncharacterized protein n=1 Tax=Pirellula staleyi (strain ATCC 27377 / DSM 6068 / ICPB 4128) TaxID=530564 RepID=D2R4N6_PIRSD|nr:hypothetical protein Psta_2433 [Pirellula staleyi DSM 6068]
MLVARGSVLFQTLFVFAKLCFHLIDYAVECRKGSIRLADSNQVVVMLERHTQFYPTRLMMFDAMLGIDSHVDAGNAIEKSPHHFDFFSDTLLRSFAQMTMTGGNVDLHR